MQLHYVQVVQGNLLSIWPMSLPGLYCKMNYCYLGFWLAPLLQYIWARGIFKDSSPSLDCLSTFCSGIYSTCALCHLQQNHSMHMNSYLRLHLWHWLIQIFMYNAISCTMQFHALNYAVCRGAVWALQNNIVM